VTDPSASGDVGIVIVTYNSEPMIEGLLDSLPAALGDLSARVVVVDNGSQDRTCEVVAARADCLLIPSTNLGYSAGINRGVRELGDVPAYLILNPDVRMAPGSIPLLVEALDIPGTGIIAPRVTTGDGELELSLRREPTILRSIGLNWTNLPLFAEYIGPERVYARPRTADWALGAVLLVSAECRRRVGEWDESFFLYSEETDYCLRARDLGLATRYVPAAQAVHIGAQSGVSAAIHAMQIVNRVRLYRRRHTTLAAFAYLMANVLSEITWGLRGHRYSWFAARALLNPRLRPEACGCGDRLLPR
jgi:N-acetylglucosaminyl-diphospho-decaprenol L-rhamnosyltransferase